MGDVLRRSAILLVFVAVGLFVFSLPIASSFLVPVARAESPFVSERDSFSWMEGYSLVLLATDDVPTFVSVRNAVEASGARVAVAVPPRVILGWIPPELSSRISSLPGVMAIYREPLPASLILEIEASDQVCATALRFFNSVVNGELKEQMIRDEELSLMSPFGGADRRPLTEDAFDSSEIDMDAYLDNLRSAGLDVESEVQRLSATDGIFSVLGNADNMTGTVTVTLFFVESDGTMDSNLYTWSTSNLNSTVNASISGLSWWSNRASTYGKSVSFTVYYYPGTDVRCQTGYEPILHSSSETHYWVEEIMASFGYSSGTHLTRVAAYNTWAKANYGTNWAFSSFVEYNPWPAPTAFTDGYSAWAYFGGPYSNLLYRSFGWAFNVVYSHETGHIFWACDEYYSAGYGGCTSCGICSHDVINGNCEYCNPQAVACMMRVNSDALCVYTPGHVGWLTAPILKYYSHSISDPTGNNNGVADAGESVTMPVVLKNWGLPATGVSATLSTADPYITITGNYSAYTDMVLGGTATSSTPYAFTAAPGTPAAHVVTFTLNIIGTGYDTTATFDIQVGTAPILLVDDDDGDTYETYYKAALDANGYSYAYWNRGTQGTPPLSELQKRKVVIWFNAFKFFLTLNGLDETTLTSYLNGGGTLFFSSENYVNETFADFAINMLHAVAYWPNVFSEWETGISGDPISDGLNLTMSYPFDNYSDEITPDSRAGVVFLHSTGNPGALRYPAVGTAAYKVVFFPFPFEAIANATAPNNRATVMYRIVQWLMAPQDYEPPSVTVASPNGGETWTVGDEHEITWVASDNVAVDSVSIICSYDGGATFLDTIAVREENDSTYTWTIPNNPSTGCQVRIIAYDNSLNSTEDVSDGFFTIESAVGVETTPGVAWFGLSQNYPNPFNPLTRIEFSLGRETDISLKVYDMTGRLVRTLAKGRHGVGRHGVPWDGRDDSGTLVASGVYSYRLESSERAVTRKMVLLR